MFIIHGMYGGKKIRTIQQWYYCKKCGGHSGVQCAVIQQWAHVFFIPVFPLTHTEKPIVGCVHCQHLGQVRKAKVPKLGKRLLNEYKALVSSLVREDSVGHRAKAGFNRLDRLRYFYWILSANNEEQHLEKLIGPTLQKAPPASAALIRGGYLEFQAEHKIACDVYATTLKELPDHLELLLALGNAYLRLGYPSSASELFEKHLVNAETEDEIQQSFSKLTQHYCKGVKNYTGACEMLERVFEVRPELMNRKEISKLYLKAKMKRSAE